MAGDYAIKNHLKELTCPHGRLRTIMYQGSSQSSKSTHIPIDGYKYCADCGSILKIEYKVID
jgi:hypothetical protein